MCNVETMYLGPAETMKSLQEQFHGGILTPPKTNMTMENHQMFNGRYKRNIFKWVWFYCHVLFRWFQVEATPANQQKSDCTIQSSREPTEEEKHLQSVLGADMLVPTMVSRLCILLKFVLGHVHRDSLGFLKLSSVRCYRGNKETMRTEQAKPSPQTKFKHPSLQYDQKKTNNFTGHFPIEPHLAGLSRPGV